MFCCNRATIHTITPEPLTPTANYHRWLAHEKSLPEISAAADITTLRYICAFHKGAFQEVLPACFAAAIASGKTETLTLLIEKKIDLAGKAPLVTKPDGSTSGGEEWLLTAVRANQPACVALIMGHREAVLHKKACIELAIKNRFEECLHVLLSSETTLSTSTLHLAFAPVRSFLPRTPDDLYLREDVAKMKSTLRIFRALYEKGVVIETDTFINIAGTSIALGDEKALQQVITGAAKTVSTVTKSLHLTRMLPHCYSLFKLSHHESSFPPAIIDICLEAGALIHADFPIQTLLHRAVEYHDEVIARTCRAKGALVDYKTSSRLTPWQEAMATHDMKAAKILADLGARAEEPSLLFWRTFLRDNFFAFLKKGGERAGISGYSVSIAWEESSPTSTTETAAADVRLSFEDSISDEAPFAEISYLATKMHTALQSLATYFSKELLHSSFESFWLSTDWQDTLTFFEETLPLSVKRALRRHFDPYNAFSDLPVTALIRKKLGSVLY